MEDSQIKIEERRLLEKIEQHTSILPRLFKGKIVAITAEADRTIKKTLIPRLRDELGRFTKKQEGAVKTATATTQRANAISKPIVEAPAPSKEAIKPVSEKTELSQTKEKPTTAQKPVAQVKPHADIQKPVPESVKTQQKPVTPTVQITTAEIVKRNKPEKKEQPVVAEVMRDKSGRFLSAGVQEHEARKKAKQDQDQKKTLSQSIKDGLKGLILGKDGKDSSLGKGAVEDAAGKAAGGAYWDAAKELADAAGEIREKAKEDDMFGRTLRKIGSRFGRKDTTTVAVEKTEKAEQKRHREVIEAIQGENHSTEGGSSVATTVLETLGLNKLFGKFFPAGGAIATLATGLKTIALPLTGLVAGFGAVLSILNRGKENGVGYNPTAEESKALTASPEVKLDKNMVPFQSEFQAAASKTGVDPNLLMAVARKESGFEPSAISKVGAVGIMQIMPVTAAALGVDPTSVPDNIMGGAKHLSSMLKKYGDIETALQAYNWGDGNMDAYLRTGKGAKGQAMPRETREYAKAVMRNYEAYAGQPSLPTEARTVTATPITVTKPETKPVTNSATIKPVKSTTAPVQKAIIAPKPVTQPVQLEKPEKQAAAPVINTDGLEAAILKLKQGGQDKPQRTEFVAIKTQFDDTTLTLIAHDRI